MTTPDRPGGTDDLRRRAQQRLARLRGRKPDAPQDDQAALLHELQTHQIELEMQNEELRAAQAELTAARDRLADLYDFAPVGYVTVSPKGQIRQANQTAAEMLGVPRIALAGRWLSSFVARDSQPFLYDHLRRLQECGRGRHTCELCLRREDGTTFWADLDGPVVALEDGMRRVYEDLSLRHQSATV